MTKETEVDKSATNNLSNLPPVGKVTRDDKDGDCCRRVVDVFFAATICVMEARLRRVVDRRPEADSVELII